MKVVVCVKVVNGELNPFDECALECALDIEEADITVLTMGPEAAKEALLRISRLNVNKIMLISDSALAGSDTLATSYVLSTVIRNIEPDLVFCGRQSIDGDTAQVGPCVAGMLGYNLITNVMEAKITNGAECVTRAGKEIADFPALLTVERINVLRFPKIGSVLKPVEVVSAEDIKVDVNKCGLKGSPTKVLKTFESRRGSRKCKFISLSELDSVINCAINKKDDFAPKQMGEKLKSVTVIGGKLKEYASTVADEVVVIEKRDCNEIAELIRSDNAVLWPADLWGRKNAPIVAAKLGIGLCADCVMLEAENEKLYMYRPAYGGTLTAKIECRTYPQMATVRVKDGNSEDVIFGLGRGASDNIEHYTAMAKRYGASLAASRGLVDMGLADYSRQVGLTGKIISPKVYVACGISGAVQHTCGFENAGTVIAINTDKNARIFEYADYGIIV